MSLIKYVERLKRMDDLIKRKATGSPDEFAEKMNISKSMLMLNLSELKLMGAPIKYSPILQSYFYDGECTLKLGFEVESEVAKKVIGGLALPSLSISGNYYLAGLIWEPCTLN